MGVVHLVTGWNTLLSWVAVHTLRAEQDLTRKVLLAEVSCGLLTM